jgi:uncharacterized Tic20 family protein
MAMYGFSRVLPSDAVILLWLAVLIAAIVQTRIAGLRAWNGLDYRMPLVIRFLR